MGVRVVYGSGLENPLQPQLSITILNHNTPCLALICSIMLIIFNPLFS
jgi:hypothetical protein